MSIGLIEEYSHIDMKIEFICGTICMIAILLVVVLFSRRRENFATLNTNVTLGNVNIPDPDNPNSKPSVELTVDVSGNGAIPIAITNLSEIQGATTSSLQGKNLPKMIDDKISNKASEVKSKQDSVADIRKAVRREIENERRFQLPEEDLDMIEDKHRTTRLGGCKNYGSPALDQGCDYNNDSECNNNYNTNNSCESPEYIRKDKIPCWGCTLPTSTD